MKKYIFITILFAVIISCTNNKTRTFKKSDYGKNWPYSVNEIEVYCEGYKEIYFKADNGKTYPLNGTAKGVSKNNFKISNIDEIWLANPDLPGTKIPYPQEFINDGLLLCPEE